jgi:hypothetical protein
MTENEVVEIIKNHIIRQFPKKCNACGRLYHSLADYLKNTTHVGDPISYDAEMGNWRPTKLVGTASFANCQCGSTLVIDSKGMELLTMCRLLLWARKESSKRGISIRKLLSHLRQQIDNSILKCDGKSSVGLGNRAG